MEDTEFIINSIDKKNKDNQDTYNCLLRKIRHKPIIMSSIYSFVQSRPYILYHLISKDLLLKSSLKSTFVNAKKDNDFSKELNENINHYKLYRGLKDKLTIDLEELKQKIFNENEKLNNIIQKPKRYSKLDINALLENFKNSEAQKLIQNLLDEDFLKTRKILLELYYSRYSELYKFLKSNRGELCEFNWKYINSYIYEKLNEQTFYTNYMNYIKGNLFNEVIAKELKKKKIYFLKKSSKKLLKKINYYEYVTEDKIILVKIYNDLSSDNDKNLFLEKILSFYCDFLATEEISIILSPQFDKFPLSTKKYRDLCQKYVNEEIKKNGNELYIKNINQSIILEILDKYFKNNYDKNKLISLFFDYLSTLDNVFLYNLPDEEKNNFDNKNKDINTLNKFNNLSEDFLDRKYLTYIENSKSITQKISLICIIDRYKYCEYINNVVYPNIYELHFKLFSNSNINELFMFNDIPINEIYNIFISYILNIKNYKNIEIISFGDEFFLNKNQFLNYNENYYQSIISYLIDQYLFSYINSKNNILEEIKTKKIKLKEDKLNNIYEQYKIIYGFNKLFPNLEIKKILEINYNEIINNNDISNSKCNYKIIDINFENISIKEDFNIIFNNIINYINKNYKFNSLNSLEIISFSNFDFSLLENISKININNNFDLLPNLKEFFINNNNYKKGNNNDNIIKTKYFDEIKLFNKFDFLYLGYDIIGNLIYYRNGKNMIKSTDILDLLNIFNNKIIKLKLKYENIDIIVNEDKSILKIINLNENNDKINVKYNYPLKNLFDFINNQTTLNELTINGFDFTFEEIKNKNIKKLFINYDNNSNKLVNYNFVLSDFNQDLLIKDMNMKNKFPLLEEINIGNIKNEIFLFNNLFQIKNFNNNLKNINIITYKNYKPKNIDNKTINISIVPKTKNENKNEKENLFNDITENEENEINYNNNEDDEENEEYEEDELFYDKYQDILEEENPLVTNVPIKKRKIIKVKQSKLEKEKSNYLVKAKLASFTGNKKNQYNKDIKSILKEENIIYFDNDNIKDVNDYYLIHQSLLLVNNKLNIKKIKFNLLHKIGDYNEIFEYKFTKNLFILITEKYDRYKYCIFLKNENSDIKGDDFLLDLKRNEIYYHIKEGDIKKQNENEISREKCDIRKDENRNKQNLIKYFFGDVDIHRVLYYSECFIEIYQIIFL